MNDIATHTRGPWFIWNDKIKSEAGGWQQKTYIAEIPNHTGAEESANAHLIAAAPELLEALEELVDCEWPQPADLQAAQERARAVIAKATGRME